MQRAPQGYEAVEELIATANSVIYRAKRISDGSPVAIKRARMGTDYASERARANNERDCVQSITSDHVVRVFEVSEADDHPCLIMELLDGARTLEQRSNSDARDLAAQIRIAIGIVQGLRDVHAAGVIHRDIKPGNVMLVGDREHVKLIDFGLASTLERTPADPADAQLEGTLAYIAPEQTGRMNRHVDYRSDYYSLGATLYELFCGTAPFAGDGDPMTLIHAHIARRPVALHERDSKIAKSLSSIVDKLMSKSAEDRYQGSHGILRDLTRCLEELQNDGQIGDFEVGQHDRSERFQICQTLFGRESEIEELNREFARAVAGETILLRVSGHSGIGKTSLIHECQPALVEHRGLFVHGKFDQFSRNAPYAALLQAIGDGLRQLMTADDEALDEHRDRLLRALGRNGQLMVDLVPELDALIGRQPPPTPAEGREAEKRFRDTLAAFVGALSPQDRPLVLFLDDLQWADSATLQFLEHLCSQDEGRRVLILAAYRDNEVDEAHPFAALIRRLESEGLRTPQLALGPLSAEDTERLVAATLAGRHDADLATLVHRRSQGNPFFINQLLTTLYKDGCIRLDADSGRWSCDVEAARQTQSSEDVIALLEHRFASLDEAAREAASLAACIGASFDLATLTTISGGHDGCITPAEVSERLWTAIRDGFVVPLGAEATNRRHQDLSLERARHLRYRFVHDRVQQAAESLLGESRDAVHLRIARLLLDGLEPEDIDERIHEVVRHGNLGRQHMSAAERVRFRDLNARAARRSQASTSYASAIELFAVAIELAGPDDSDQAFALGMELAASRLMSGDLERCERELRDLEPNAPTPAAKIQVSTMLLAACLQQGRLDQALQDAIRLANERGLDYATGQAPETLAPHMGEVLGWLGTNADDDILARGAITDPVPAAMARFMIVCVPLFYMSGETTLYSRNVLELVKISMRDGHSSETAYAFAALGVVVALGMQDYTSAKRYGELSFRLFERFPSKVNECQAGTTYGAIVHYVVRPMRESVDLFNRAYELGREAGEVAFASYAKQLEVNAMFYAGYPVGRIVEEYRASESFCNRTGATQLAAAQAAMTLGADLLRRSENLDWQCVPREGYGDEATVLGMMAPTGHFLRLTTAAHAALFHGEYAKCRELFVQSQAYAAAGPGLQCTFIAPMWDAIAACQLHASGHETPDFEPLINAQLESVAVLERHCEANALAFRYLLEASLAQAQGRHDHALDRYDDAIEAASMGQVDYVGGLAAALAGAMLVQDRPRRARPYLQDAVAAYRTWGALGPAARIERAHPQLFQGRRDRSSSIMARSPSSSLVRKSTSSSTMQRDSSAALDTASIVKAAASLSSEVSVEGVLRALMSVLVEQAGARRAAFIPGSEGPGQSKVCAATGDSGLDIDVDPTGGAAFCSHGVVRYVQRTKQALVIDDVGNDAQWSSDSDLQAAAAKSVLAIPVVRAGQLAGVVYMDHDASPGAFTDRRVQLSGVLASQLAISLENAEIYENLEQRVSEQTANVRRREHAMRLVLDSMADGLLECSLDGRLTDNRSRSLTQWFGEPGEHDRVWSYLFGHDPSAADVMEMSFESLVDGMMPYDVCVAQMPRRIERDNRTYALDYAKVEVDGQWTRVLITVADISDQLARERAEADRRELPEIFAKWAQDPRAFAKFLRDVERDFAELSDAVAEGVFERVKRSLHTLKGNTAIYGFARFARRLHEVEDLLGDETLTPSGIEDLRSLWRAHSGPVADLDLDDHEASISLARGEYESFLGHLESTDNPVTSTVREWVREPTRPALRQIQRQAVRMADRLNKPVDVIVEDRGLRWPRTDLAGFLASLVHVIRNALDHGLESRDERAKAGKASTGRLYLRTLRDDRGRFVLSIADDGRGIDWSKIRERLGDGASSEPSKLVDALFEDGLSTRDEVSELSGRGVGLSATRASSEACGIGIEVDSRPGETCEFRFVIPDGDDAVRASTPVSTAA